MAINNVTQAIKVDTANKLAEEKAQKRAQDEKIQQNAAAQKDLLVLSQEAKNLRQKENETQAQEAQESKAQEMSEKN